MSDVRLIEYEEQGTEALGFEVAQRDPHLKAQYVDSQGRLVRIHPQRILRRYASVIRLTQDAASFLAFLDREARELQERVDFPTLWELFHGQDETPAFETFCELALGRADLAAQVAVMRALRQESAYFRINRDDTLSPRDPETVRALLIQQEREKKNRIRQEQFVDHITQAIQNGTAVTRSDVEPSLFDAMRQFALSDGQDGPWQGIAPLTERIARACGIPENPLWAAAFEILQKTGTFGPLDCPAVCALSPPESFPEEALRQATAITAAQGSAVSASAVVTIDDEETLDIDDALQIDPLPDGGFRLQVHITDPGRGIPAGSPLELEARRRATSIYLPTRRIPMLPEIVSENTLSLVAGQPREVISYIADVAQGGIITGTQVRMQTIAVTHRLTYETANAVLAGQESVNAAVDQMLLHLFSVTQVLRQARIHDGIMESHLPEAKVRVSPDGSIRIKVIDADSPAHTLVSECMILANTMAGTLARDQRLPVLYRIQKPPELPHPNRDNSGLMQWPRKLRKGELSCHPAPHYGLGVDVYVQASSPLRRYADLLATHQIRAFLLKEKPPFTAEDLMPILGNAEAVAEEATRVERRSTRYWLIRALAMRPPQRVQALIIESRGTRAQAMVEELALRIPVTAPRPVSPGDRIVFDVKAADPLRDEVVVEHVQIL